MGLIQDLFDVVGRQEVKLWYLVPPTLFAILGAATYLSTLASHLWTRYNSKDGQEPPVIPYWIPIVGSTIPFVRDTKGFIAKTM